MDHKSDTSNIKASDAEATPQTPTVRQRLKREAIVLMPDRGRIGLLVALCTMAGLASGFALGNLARAAHEPVPAVAEVSPQPIGWLGVRITDAAGGAEVDRVFPNSPAERMGLKAGDVISRFDGKRVRRAAELVWFVRRAGPGARVTLRKGVGCQAERMQVTLGQMPASLTRFVNRRYRR